MHNNAAPISWFWNDTHAYILYHFGIESDKEGFFYSGHFNILLLENFCKILKCQFSSEGEDTSFLFLNIFGHKNHRNVYIHKKKTIKTTKAEMKRKEWQPTLHLSTLSSSVYTKYTVYAFSKNKYVPLTNEAKFM